MSVDIGFDLQELNGFKSVLSTFLWATIAKLYFEVSNSLALELFQEIMYS